MSSFVISVLAFLLTIFPSCSFLLAPYQSMTFPGEVVIAEDVLSAIEAQDVAALEAMFCPAIRTQTEDLYDQIAKLIDAIDGDIVKMDRSPSSSYSKPGFNEFSWDIDIETTATTYLIMFGWMSINTTNSEEVGLNYLSLIDLGLLSLNPEDESVWRLARVPAAK
jgi:hypothetical protein